MDWYLEREGASGTRVDLTAYAAPITVTVPQTTVVRDGMDGTRTVYKFPAGKPNITIPTLFFDDELEVERLKGLVESPYVLTLATHTGATYRCTAINGITIVEPTETVDRYFEVTITLVGV